MPRPSHPPERELHCLMVYVRGYGDAMLERFNEVHRQVNANAVKAVQEPGVDIWTNGGNGGPCKPLRTIELQTDGDDLPENPNARDRRDD